VGFKVPLAEDFERIDLNEVNDYVAAQQEENLVLEFKSVNSADLSNADDKKNLAKALSGFANSSGGIIVWGVEARKTYRALTVQ
jgi:predicted HTH transcriptional regulator